MMWWGLFLMLKYTAVKQKMAFTKLKDSSRCFFLLFSIGGSPLFLQIYIVIHSERSCLSGLMCELPDLNLGPTVTVTNVTSIEEGWGQKPRQRSWAVFVQFLAAVYLKETVLFNRFLQIDRGKTDSAARNWTNLASQIDATTSALASVPILLLLWLPVNQFDLYTQHSVFL